MSSKANKDLDDLMLKVDSMDSPEKDKEKIAEEDPKQEVDKEEKETEVEVDSDKNSEPSPEADMEQPIGLNTDEIDYPEDDANEQEMDAEASKLPELTTIRDGGEFDGSEDSKENSSSESGKKNNEKIKSLKQNSTSGMIEFVSASFEEKNPEHSVCCVMKDKVISLKGEEAYETMYVSSDENVKFNQSVRNRELEEQKEVNNDIIEKLLNFDNI